MSRDPWLPHQAKYRAYIAGPMTGYPQWNFPAFDAAAEYLRSRGIDAVNPADLDRAAGFTGDGAEDPDLQAAMRRDIEALLTVDGVLLLPGWQKSVGANLELSIAAALGLDVFEYDPAAEALYRRKMVAA